MMVNIGVPRGAKETIKKYKPTIVFENMDFYGTYLYENILKYYEISEEISKFNIIDYCMSSLSYKECIKGYNTYLIP